MPQNQTLKCASCDADLAVTPDAVEIVCGACGTLQSIENHDGFSEVVEISPAPHRVVDVFRYLVRHPVEMLVWRWNWKAAVCSGVVRSMIYLLTHLKAGWRAALGAMSIEFIFRLVVSGSEVKFPSEVTAVRGPAWTLTKGSPRFFTNDTSRLLVIATPFTSRNESGKYAKRIESSTKLTCN